MTNRLLALAATAATSAALVVTIGLSLGHRPSEAGMPSPTMTGKTMSSVPAHSQPSLEPARLCPAICLGRRLTREHPGKPVQVRCEIQGPTLYVCLANVGDSCHLIGVSSTPSKTRIIFNDPGPCPPSAPSGGHYAGGRAQ